MTQFKFKAGYKVKRIRSEHEGMKVGDIGVVKSFENSMNMYLEGYRFAHDPENFELVVEDEKENISKWLRENKWFIRTGNPEKSKLVQEWLFEHGYEWLSGKGVSYTDRMYLCNVDTGGGLHDRILQTNSDKSLHKSAKELTFEFETVVKSVKLPTIESEKDKKIRELQETIQSAANQIKAIKEEM